MEFHEDKLEDFRAVFEVAQPKIRAFPGCSHVEVCSDPADSCIRYTFSKWDSEADLDAYRYSQLFKETWAATKVHFKGKPRAYSMITQ